MMVEPFRRRVVAQAVHDPKGFPAGFAAEMLTGATFSPGFAVALPVQTVEDLAARMPNASLELWSDVAHHPMIEQPARFNERLRAFVRDGT
jgi:pimeloyl-ACP methyl ester carboxylesterase